MKTLCYSTFFVFLSIGNIDCVCAENWPQWRGPEFWGVAPPGDYPVEFDAEKNVAWKIALPGRGSSTPVVWKDQLFITSPIEGHDGVVSYDLSGQEIWRQQFGAEREGKHRNGSGSNPSPVTDGKHLVVYYKSGTLACLDLQGDIRWQKNIQHQHGQDTLWWDLGTSPVLAGDKVIVAVIHEGDSYLVAYFLENGKIAWKQDRNYENPIESDQSYATPHIVTIGGKKVVVTWGADHLTGHDTETGKQIWECGGFNPDNKKTWRVIASPAIDREMAVVPYGRAGFLAGVRLDGQGDVTESHRVWERTGGTDVPTPVLDGNRVLILSDRGEVLCIDKKTGEDLWADKLPRARAKYFASPLLAGGRLYCVREDGVVTVAEADDKLNVLAENDMGESIVASPVPVPDGLLLRGAEHLFCIGN